MDENLDSDGDLQHSKVAAYSGEKSPLFFI